MHAHSTQAPLHFVAPNWSLGFGAHASFEICSLHECVHHQISDRCLIFCHPCWTWVSKKTWRHGYCERERIRTRFPTEQNYAHTHDSTLRNQRWIRHVSCHTALSAFACCSGCRGCVAWIVTVCICLRQCPLRGCRRFSRVRGTVDAVDVVLAVFLLLLPLVFFSNNFIGKLFVWIIFTIPPATSAPACPRTTF